MNIDPLEVLRNYRDEPKLGSVASQALHFLEGTQCKFLHSSGRGQSSLWVARMYEIRKSLEKFRRDAFFGLEESIESLRQVDVNVHLWAIETEKGIVSVWLMDESSPPVGVVIAKFE